MTNSHSHIRDCFASFAGRRRASRMAKRHAADSDVARATTLMLIDASLLADSVARFEGGDLAGHDEIINYSLDLLASVIQLNGKAGTEQAFFAAAAERAEAEDRS
jgi:hypothetical protein